MSVGSPRLKPIKSSFTSYSSQTTPPLPPSSAGETDLPLFLRFNSLVTVLLYLYKGLGSFCRCYFLVLPLYFSQSDIFSWGQRQSISTVSWSWGESTPKSAFTVPSQEKLNASAYLENTQGVLVYYLTYRPQLHFI